MPLDPEQWAALLHQVLDQVMAASPRIIGIGSFFCACLAVGHALLTKDDERAAAGWVGVICLVPVVGPLLYFILGINRIRRRASARSSGRRRPVEARPTDLPTLDESADSVAPHLETLRRLVGRVVKRPLLPANHVEPLANGEAAYGRMLATIEEAQVSVAMCTYIFDHDAAGALFHDCLKRAVRRGVAVCVLIDAVGARYSWPSMARALRRDGIRVALFNPTVWPWRMAYANLRCHRKILLVDGTWGFTGGMNIRAGHLVQRFPKQAIIDVHFAVRGPVVAHLWEALFQDWYQATGEALTGSPWRLTLAPQGEVLARGVSDGPDEDINKLHWVLMGALACAEKSIHIVTPYFLPDQALIAAINTAALRGVEVTILLPGHNNLTLVQWACTAVLPQLLNAGCKIYRVQTSFDHSKIMVIDGVWSLIGSANWDPRSLRLNFEHNIECYSASLADKLGALIAEKMAYATAISAYELRHQPLAVRLRDNLARLASPFL